MADAPPSLQREIVETLLRIYQSKMTTTSGGNLSIREVNGDTWITPARVDKGGLAEQDIVRIRPDGSVDGLHPPSSEYQFHMQIFASRPDIKAIIHAHPVALVAHAISRQLPDLSLLPTAASICGQVDYAPYIMPGSYELGESIANVFAKGADCVIMQNHGVVIGGESMKDAFCRFETLETCAATLIKARQLGKPHVLTPKQVAMADRDKLAVGRRAIAQVAVNEKVCGDLCRFIRRGYGQRLFTSTQGSFSARMAGQFVVNGEGADRKIVASDDVVVVQCGGCGPRPDRLAAIHQAIYARHEQVQAVIIASPVHATAFAVCGTEIASRSLPESYLFLKDLLRIPFEHVMADPEAVAAKVCMEHPAALLENEGVLVVGKSILDAFDRLEVLENTAAALLYSRQLGTTHVISDEEIAALVQKFPF